jgi:hypothetical protein
MLATAPYAVVVANSRRIIAKCRAAEDRTRTVKTGVRPLHVSK